MGAKPKLNTRKLPRDFSSVCLSSTEYAPLPMAPVEGASHILCSSGELNQLARAFNEMTESLQRQSNAFNNPNTTLERRVAEQTAQLESLNKELDAFSHSVSHDLRAPLRHIEAYSKMLRQESGWLMNDKSARYLENICDATKRMGRLLGDLLTFARTSRDEMRSNSVRMDKLVDQVLHEMQGGSNGRKIEWRIKPLPQVMGNRPMLRKVWANLLSNAIKYTRSRERAEIQVGCRDHAAEIEFWVRDNGVGFDMQYANRLFGVFQRLHRDEEFEGTGISLAYVRRIIERHGGRTWAKGEVDEGATFYFTLPNKGKG